MRVVVCGMFSVLWLFASLAAGSDETRPNILFIMSDDHAAHAISAYGGRLAEVAPTPNIDRLAREGALFANAVLHQLDLFAVASLHPDRAIRAHQRRLRSQRARSPGQADVGDPNAESRLSDGHDRQVALEGRTRRL